MPDCGYDGPTYEVLRDKAAIDKKGAIIRLRATTLNVDGSYSLAGNPDLWRGKRLITIRFLVAEKRGRTVSGAKP
ncbi:hypothetical protein GCM10028774_16590 [Spirosoma jeollabukense]